MISWDAGLIAVFACACVVLLLFVVNVVLAAGRGAPSDGVTMGIYLLAVVTILVNLARIASTAVGSVIAGNVVALVCILVSMQRFRKERRERGKEP